MDKDSPRARFVRTLLASIAGYAASWASIDWFTNYRAGYTVVTLNLVAALLAGGIAYLNALRTTRPRDAVGKALYTLAQNLAPGLSTLVLADLTTTGLVNFGRSLVSTIIGAALAAVATLGLNAAEDPPAT